MAAITINFPVDPTINKDGQWNKLQKNGDRWELANTTTKQTKALTGKGLTRALQLVVEPLMS